MGMTGDKLLLDANNLDVIAAMEENLIAYVLYCSCIPGAQAHTEHDHISALTGIFQPTLNVVMRPRLSIDAIDRRISEIMEPFRKRQLPMLWWLFPGTRPMRLASHLERYGLSHHDDEPGMVMDLRLLPAKPCNSRIQITEIESWSALRKWIHTSSLAFGGDPDHLDPQYVKFEQCLGWGQDLPYRRFLATIDDQPVATSAIFLGAGVVGLYSVGAIPAFRRQGIGSAISIAALHAARDEGYRIGVLQSSPQGYHVYHNLGFREYCRIHSYLWYGSRTETML